MSRNKPKHQESPRPEVLAYTVPELAQAARSSRSALYLQIKSGALRTAKIGARTVIRRADADAWLANLGDGK